MPIQIGQVPRLQSRRTRPAKLQQAEEWCATAAQAQLQRRVAASTPDSPRKRLQELGSKVALSNQVFSRPFRSRRPSTRQLWQHWATWTTTSENKHEEAEFVSSEGESEGSALALCTNSSCAGCANFASTSLRPSDIGELMALEGTRHLDPTSCVCSG